MIEKEDDKLFEAVMTEGLEYRHTLMINLAKLGVSYPDDEMNEDGLRRIVRFTVPKKVTYSDGIILDSTQIAKAAKQYFSDSIIETAKHSLFDKMGAEIAKSIDESSRKKFFDFVLSKTKFQYNVSNKELTQKDIDHKVLVAEDAFKIFKAEMLNLIEEELSYHDI